MLDNLRLLRHYFSFNLRINLPTEVGVSLFCQSLENRFTIIGGRCGRIGTNMSGSMRVTYHRRGENDIPLFLAMSL